MKPPRGLSPEEAAAWARVASTVQPLAVSPNPIPSATATPPPVTGAPAARIDTPSTKPQARPSVRAERATAPVAHKPQPPGLDSHWDRRFRAGAIEPDFTLDLHGHTLDGAYDRLDTGLAQARAMGARVVLVIAGKSRPAEGADRGTQRGAIRRKLLDWLAAGPHGVGIAAVRPAHRKHGGEGALYLVLKKRG